MIFIFRTYPQKGRGQFQDYLFTERKMEHRAVTCHRSWLWQGFLANSRDPSFARGLGLASVSPLPSSCTAHKALWSQLRWMSVHKDLSPNTEGPDFDYFNYRNKIPHGIPPALCCFPNAHPTFPLPWPGPCTSRPPACCLLGGCTGQVSSFVSTHLRLDLNIF